MVETIKNIIHSISPSIDFYYEYNELFNTKANDIRVGTYIALLEEGLRGEYGDNNSDFTKIAFVDLMFGICVTEHQEASLQDAIQKYNYQKNIEYNVIYPFIKKIKTERKFIPSTVKWESIINPFDAGIVWIKLSFKMRSNIQCEQPKEIIKFLAYDKGSYVYADRTNKIVTDIIEN